MTVDEYAFLDGTALAALVKQGEVTVQQLVELALYAYELVNPDVNAVIETYEDALQVSESALQARVRRGPFAGVPFLFKDAGASEAGRRQEFGSRLLRGRVAQQSSYLAEHFQAAGLMAVGRSAAPEFSLSLSTESVLRGPTRNPWDTSRLAGGSSGGAAAAVAAGIVPMAHATDAAGSIRIPASACGLVGLKLSRGRVTHGPDEGEPLMGMDSEFIISRSVRDSASMLNAVAGPAPGDPFVISPLGLGAMGPLRIAVTTTPWGGYAIDPEIKAGILTLADDLVRLGHKVEESSPVFDYEAFVSSAVVGWAFGFDLLLEALALEMGRPIDETTLEPVTLRLYESAKELRSADVARAIQGFNKIRRTVGTFFERYDLLMTPTLLQKPEEIGRYSQSVPHPDFESFFRLCDESGAFLPLFNMTGQPAISLPLLWSSEGLPLGVQFAARFGEEGTLLRLAAALEELWPWQARQPAVHVRSAANRVQRTGEARASTQGRMA